MQGIPPSESYNSAVKSDIIIIINDKALIVVPVLSS